MTDVKVCDLTVEYASGGFPVRPLDQFNASVESGSLALLLGPSGCGKSTMLSCLAGILRPTEGEIRVGGAAVESLSGAELTAYRQRGVGIVFQSFNLVPSLSALENVAAPLRAASMPRRSANDRAARLLASVGLEREADRVPSRLSGGQQQRVAIARALAHDPPLLLADEPTAHLDYIQVEEVLRLLRGLAIPGRSVIVATHDERMLPLADSVIEMTPKFADGADALEERDLDAGEVLFEQGSRGSRIYVVVEGEIDIVRSHDDGREDVLAVARAGDHFGEMGPLFNLPRSATARARTQARVTGYTVRQFGSQIGLERLGNILGKAKREPAPRKARANGRARSAN